MRFARNDWKDGNICTPAPGACIAKSLAETEADDNDALDIDAERVALHDESGWMR